MPPHCDSLDGPVVSAARQALDEGDVELVLPYVPADGEAEVQAVFEVALAARAQGGAAREVADRLFFETVVRIHRAGEGAPFTGLKPSGLAVGPVIPLAEVAIATGSATELASYLSEALTHELNERLAQVQTLAMDKDLSTAAARRYVEAALGFQVYSHHLLKAIHAPAHEGT